MSHDPAQGTALILVGVDAPIGGALTYAAPAPAPVAGCRVRVPLGRRQVAGVVLGPHEGPAPPGLRSISAVLDPEPALPVDVLAMIDFASRYYRSPLGELLRAALPPGLGRVEAPRLHLSGDGAKMLQAALLSGLAEDELALLRLLQARPRSARALRQKGVRLATPKALVAQGLADWRSPTTSRDRRQVLRYRRVEGADVERLPQRARAMRDVLELLRDGQARSRAELERMRPGAAATLARLCKRGLVQVETHDQQPGATPALADHSAVPQLSHDQERAAAAILDAVEPPRAQGFLLHGVTSSGKTEVYLRAAEHALAHDRGVLVLVPEIALTPQLVGRFEHRLGTTVEVLHSGLGRSERQQRWQRVRSGEARVVIGARSAVFAPVANLGLIVVDEEHESSFKQEDSPRYNGRDLAIWRARELGCPIVLGSATPSLESYHGAQTGRLQLLCLPERVAGATLPSIEVVSLAEASKAQEAIFAGEPPILTPTLRRELESCMQRGEQAILFLNRRGFAPFVLCLDCGETVGCPNCSVTLTHHRHGDRLLCHYCAHEEAIPERCGRCEGQRVVPFGLGTQRVESALRELYPEMRVQRVDRDSTRRQGALIQTLQAFARGDIDVLVGTQMLAKGHDYPGVTLVGVLVADVGLAVADFRAAERTFQLLMQVAGRAGRGRRRGRVIVQAFDGEHPAIVFAQRHDFGGFAEAELEERRLLSYPPFGRLALLRVESSRLDRAEQSMRELYRRGRARVDKQVVFLGPAPAPLARLRNKHRLQLLIKAPSVRSLMGAVGELEKIGAQLDPGARLIFDVDPALVL